MEMAGVFAANVEFARLDAGLLDALSGEERLRHAIDALTLPAGARRVGALPVTEAEADKIRTAAALDLGAVGPFVEAGLSGLGPTYAEAASALQVPVIALKRAVGSGAVAKANGSERPARLGFNSLLRWRYTKDNIPSVALKLERLNLWRAMLGGGRAAEAIPAPVEKIMRRFSAAELKLARGIVQCPAKKASPEGKRFYVAFVVWFTEYLNRQGVSRREADNFTEDIFPLPDVCDKCKVYCVNKNTGNYSSDGILFKDLASHGMIEKGGACFECPKCGKVIDGKLFEERKRDGLALFKEYAAASGFPLASNNSAWREALRYREGMRRARLRLTDLARHLKRHKSNVCQSLNAAYSRHGGKLKFDARINKLVNIAAFLETCGPARFALPRAFDAALNVVCSKLDKAFPVR